MLTTVSHRRQDLRFDAMRWVLNDALRLRIPTRPDPVPETSETGDHLLVEMFHGLCRMLDAHELEAMYQLERAGEAERCPETGQWGLTDNGAQRALELYDAA